MATSAGTVLGSVLDRIRDPNATMMATNTPATTANGQVLVYSLISYAQQLLNLAERQIVNQVALQLNTNQVIYNTLSMATDFCAKVLAVTLGTSTTTSTTTTTYVTPTFVQHAENFGGIGTTSLNVTLPHTPVPGNLMLLMVNADSGASSWTPPAGFTAPTSTTGVPNPVISDGSHLCSFWTRVVQPGDGTSYTLSWVGTGGTLGPTVHMEEWTIANAPSGATINIVIDAFSNLTLPTDPSGIGPGQVTTTGSNEIIISFFGYHIQATTFVIPAELTELFYANGFGFLGHCETAAGYMVQSGGAGLTDAEEFATSGGGADPSGLTIALQGSYTVTVSTTVFTVTNEVDGPVDYKAFGRASRAWFTATGTALLGWAPIGQTLLALVPAFASNPPSVVVRYVQLVPAVTVATSPMTVYDDTIEHVARLTALVCRLKTRQLNGFADELKSLAQDIGIEARTGETGGTAD